MKKVASSKNMPSSTSVKLDAIIIKMALVNNQFMTQMAKKQYPLGPHTPI